MPVPTSDLRWKAASAYAYHGTQAKHLPSIQTHGLMPGYYPSYSDAYSEFDDGRHLFFSDDPENVRGHYGDTLLRFPWPAETKPDMNTFGRILPHQYVAKAKVAPEHIEVEENGQWRPLHGLPHTGAKKPNKADEANAARWEAGGRRKFVAWAEHTFLPAFEKAVTTSQSLAGELFGETVFDDLLNLVHDAPELRDFSKHFGYPAAGAKDDSLIGMWGQTMGSLRLRHHGGRRVRTPNDVYERELVVLKGIVETLKTLG